MPPGTNGEEEQGAGAAPTPGEQPAENPTPATPETPEDPHFDYDKENERIEQQRQQGSRYTPAEKAQHSFRNILKELETHGIDPRTLLGVQADTEDTGQQQTGDKPLTAAEIQRMIDEGNKKAQEATLEPILDSKIAPITRSPGEAKLVKTYTNLLRPHTSNLDEAVEMGWILANRHRFKDTFAEISRGKAAERSKTDGGGGGQRTQTAKTAPTGKEADFAKSRGLVWDESGKFVSPAKKAFLDKQRASKR